MRINRNDLTISVRFDEDGEEIPTIQCLKCSGMNCERINPETDLHKCQDCEDEFIPEEYKILDSVDEYLNRGWINIKQHRFKRTIKDCTTALRLDPKSQKAFLIRGIAWGYKANQVEKEKDISEAIRLNPQDETAYYHRGLARTQLNNYGGAIQDLDEAIQIDPDFKVAIDLRASVLFQKGDFLEAVHGFSDCIRLDENDAQAYFHRGYSNQMAQNLDEALEDYNTANLIDETDLSIYYRRAEIYEIKSNFEEATSDLKKFLSLGGRNADQAAVAIEKINKWKTLLDPADSIPYSLEDFAEGQADQNDEDGVDDINSYYTLISYGEDKQSEGDLVNASLAFSKAISLDPDDSTAYVHLSSARYFSGNVAGAIDSLSSAIGVEKYHRDLCFLRGSLLQMTGRKDEAFLDFLEAIRVYLDDKFDRNVLSKIRSENNQLDIAVKKFAQSISLDPSKQCTSFIKGVLTIIFSNDSFFEKDDGFKEPIIVFNQVIKSEPDQAVYYWCRGFVQKTFKKKEEDYSKAILLKGDKAIYYFIRGYARLLESDLEGASQDFSKASELEPGNIDTYERLGNYYFHKVKDFDQAIDVFTKAIEHSPAPNLYYYRGLVIEKSGNKEGAISDFQRYLDLCNNGGDFNAEKVRERIEILLMGGDTESLTDSEGDGDSIDLASLFAHLSKNISGSAQFIDDDNKEDNGHSPDNQEESGTGDATPHSLALKNGVELNKRGDLEGAKTAFSEAIRLVPNNPTAYIYRGAVNYMMGNQDGSIEDLSKAIEINPEPSNIHLLRGGLLLLAGNVEIAIDDILKKIQSELDSMYNFIVFQSFKIGHKDIKVSVQFFARNIQVEAVDAKSNFLSGLVALLLGKSKAAIQFFNKSIEFESDNPGYFWCRGLAMSDPDLDASDLSLIFGKAFDTGNSKPSLADYSEAIRIKGDKSRYYYIRGYTSLLEFDYVGAKADFEEAIRKDPGNFETYEKLGIFYTMDSQYDVAIENLNKAIALNSERSDALFHRGLCLKEKGETQAALADFQRIIDIDYINGMVDNNEVEKLIEELSDPA